MDLKLLDEMKERLGNAVKYGTDDTEKFHVFAWEAGLGKSTHVNDSVLAYFDEFGLKDNTKKFLIVKKFKSDVYETVEHLEQCGMLKMYGCYSVIGLTSENVAKYSIDKIKSCMVLVITHQRYIEACDRELIHSFGDRDTLIIDEQVQFPITKFGRSEYNGMREDIHLYEGQVLFDKCFFPLLKRLDEIYKEESYNNIVTFQDTFDNDTLKVFKNWMKDNCKGDKRKRRYKEIIQSLELLQLDTSEGLIHNDTLYLIDNSICLRNLKNNIILDASADITPLYKIEDQFTVVENGLCINHSKSNVGYLKVNTSKSSLEKNLDYIIRDVQNRLKDIKDKKKALLVCHKVNSTEILTGIRKVLGDNVYIPKGEEDTEASQSYAAVDWYGNIVGKNTYKDYDICLIIGTHNMPLPVYLLQFVQYNPKLDVSRFPRKMELKSGKFENEQLEEFRKAFLAADFYQAARRIQRNQEPKASYLLYTFDEDVVQTFLKKFNLLSNVFELNTDNVVKPTFSTKDEKVIRILEFIRDDCAVGDVVPKKNISEVLDIHKSNLSRYLGDELIAKHKELGHIEIRNTDVVKKTDFTLE
ncbi:hypothetical protein [Virgibacillus salexigens]|uniref:Uncharacterized protein n=1 Tax=Virgibacillus kapii TaxID=1638645 RepID=A0ABQ2DQV8_9BACI|nr:hypothetical protein [Virgibacillus kapii]GGJ64425.1 hypothetical protein GCM10007111_27830 [Virgibacillus kapii]